VQTELANALDADIGLLTADKKERGGALVVVGTARCITDREWDLIAIPDVDSFLFFADSVEKGFRLVYRAAEMGRRRLLVQTRFPNHHTLRTALQGDYEAFAAEELPKRRALLYPPHAHLAEFAFEGPEEAVRRAVESRLRPTLKDGTKVLESVPHSRSEGQSVWRVLLRSPRRDALAESAAYIARLAAEDRGRNGLKVHINMDPEGV
jgi:primosomal protein N' (replication factor Y)